MGQLGKNYLALTGLHVLYEVLESEFRGHGVAKGGQGHEIPMKETLIPVFGTCISSKVRDYALKDRALSKKQAVPWLNGWKYDYLSFEHGLRIHRRNLIPYKGLSR